MKLIVGLSSLALISLSNVAPSLAASQAIGNAANQPLASQALPGTAKSFQVAGLFDSINKVLNTVDKVIKIDERQKQAEIEAQNKADRQAAQEKAKQERLAREEQAKIERQRRADAYKQQMEDRRTAEVARQAAEKVRFDSMTPAEKKAYLARKEADRKEAWDFFGMILQAGFSGGDSSVSQQDGMSDQDKWNRDHQYQAPVSQPSSQPDNRGGFYGNCHGGAAYGCK
jgi:N-acyl-D-aspartate/D-glutamate deacylase